MDHKWEHQTPPTSKGHGSGVDNSPPPALCNLLVRTVVCVACVYAVKVQG